MLEQNKTVSELVLANPGAARVFEELKIDYCCGGGKTLGEACTGIGVEVGKVTDLLRQAEKANVEPATNWTEMSLNSLIDHIEATHHVFTRSELERLAKLMAKVCQVHGSSHHELFQLEKTFQALSDELGPHLRKEENVLFPYIRALEATAPGGAPPVAPFGTVRNPVRMMSLEHDSAGQLLRELREESDNYSVPADGCGSFHALYQGLAEFEQDLHQHIHLENNLLFPRAIALENLLALVPA